MKIELKFFESHPNASYKPFTVYTIDESAKDWICTASCIHNVWAVNKKDNTILKANIIDSGTRENLRCVLLKFWDKDGGEHWYYKLNNIVVYTSYIEAYNVLNKATKESTSATKADNLKKYYNSNDAFSQFLDKAEKEVAEENPVMDIGCIKSERLWIASNGKTVEIYNSNGTYYINDNTVDFDSYTNARRIFMQGGDPNNIINSINDVYNEYVQTKKNNDRIAYLEDTIKKAQEELNKLKN